MKAAIHYPDLGVPPTGWTYVRVGTQMRLSPPGPRPGGHNATIVVAPLIPRHDGLPPIDKLIELALEAEEQLGFQVTEKTGPTPANTTTGLNGCSYEVRGYVRPRSAIERRAYVMYADPLCYYGISYVADEQTYETYQKLFWEVARSIKPFQGRIVAPQPPESAAGDGDPNSVYKD